MPSQVIPAAASAWTFKGPGGRVARTKMDAFCSGTEDFAPEKVLVSLENQRGASPTFQLTFNGSSIVIYGAVMGSTNPAVQVVLDNAAVHATVVPRRMNASSSSICDGVLAQLSMTHAIHTVTLTPDTTREQIAIFSAVVDDAVQTSAPTSNPPAPPNPPPTQTTPPVPPPQTPISQPPNTSSSPSIPSNPPPLPPQSSSQTLSESSSASQSPSGSGQATLSTPSSASAAASSGDGSKTLSASNTLSLASSPPSHTSGGSPESASPPKKSKFGVVLGSVLASLAVLFALTGAVFWPWYARRRRRTRISTSGYSNETQYTDATVSEADLEPALRPYALSSTISPSSTVAGGGGNDKLGAMKAELRAKQQPEEGDADPAALVQAVRAAGFTMQAVLSSLSRVRAASEDVDAPPPGYDPRSDPQR